MDKARAFLTKIISRQDFYKIILVCIVLLAGGLRLYRLSDNPVALNQDEAINGYDALSLGATLHDHHGNYLPPMLESFGDWSSPLITYLTIPFVKVLGLSVFSIRLPVALLGVGSTLLIYVLIKQLSKRRDLALLGSFILAVSPWDITLSRWAIPPSIVAFFFMLFLITFIWAYQSGKKTSYLQAILVGLTAGIAVYSYPTQKLFIPLFVATTFLIFIKGNFKKLVVSGIAFSILIAPIFYLTLTQPEKYNARYDSVSISQTGQNVPVGVGLRYASYFSPMFLFGSGDPDAMHQVPGYGNFDWGFALFFYLGLAALIYSIKKNKELLGIERKHLFVLLAWLVLFPIAASITKDYFMLLRVVHAFPLFIILIVTGYGLVIEKYPSEKKWLLSLMIALGLLTTGAYYKTYFTNYREASKASFNYGYGELYSYLNQNESKFNKVTIEDSLPIYYLFYSSYSPKNLQDLLKSQDAKDRYNIIGKYQFRKLVDSDFESAKEIYSVQDSTKTWFRVYEKDGDYLVRRVLN